MCHWVGLSPYMFCHDHAHNTTCTHTHHTRAHTHTIRAHTHVHIHTHVDTHTRTHTHVYTHTYRLVGITVYVEIFEWLNFRKKSAVSNFENFIFENGARLLASGSLLLSYIKILFSKTPNSFRNFRKFCHLKISTYMVCWNNFGNFDSRCYSGIIPE